MCAEAAWTSLSSFLYLSPRFVWIEETKFLERDKGNGRSLCPVIKGIHTFPFRRGDTSYDPVCLKYTEPLFLLLLPWRRFVSPNMLCLDSGIWNSSGPTSPTAQICTPSWALHCLSAHPYSSRACRSPSSLYSFSVSHSPTLSYLFVFFPLTPPPSQVSFHGLACQSPHSLKCLNHLLASLQHCHCDQAWVSVCVCVWVFLLLCINMEYVHAHFMFPATSFAC